MWEELDLFTFPYKKYKVVKTGEAEKILDELIEFYNERYVREDIGQTPNDRWEKGEREEKTRIRASPENIDLNHAFSLHYERKVKTEPAISFNARGWKVGKSPQDKVTVCFIPEKKIMIFKEKQKLWEYHL